MERRSFYNAVLVVLCIFALPAAAADPAPTAKKKIVLISGAKSHYYFAHAYYAGNVILANALNENVPGVEAVVVRNGWPKDRKVFDGAAAIVLFSDGATGNPILAHLDEVDKMMKRGVGLALLHFAVEVPKENGGPQLLDWTGGYFERSWSVNPFWTAHFDAIPQHPITRGVRPFEIEDEWYYHMRFRDKIEGVTPILTAIPPDKTRRGRDGAYSGNPAVRARMGMAEHVAWATERPDGGRGFGFTGGHHHYNWANDNFRTLVLNAIVWVAKLDVPAGGVPSKAPTMAQLLENQDWPVSERLNREKVEKTLEKWRSEAKQK